MTVSGRKGETQSYLLMHNAPPPKAVAVMFPGGEGLLRLRTEGNSVKFSQAARRGKFLGRRRRSRRSAVVRHHRQTAVRRAGRSGTRSAPVGAAPGRRQSVLRVADPGGCDRVEAGRGPSDPRRDRSWRIDAVRSAPDLARLWQAVPQEPAADADHAQRGGRAAVLQRARCILSRARICIASRARIRIHSRDCTRITSRACIFVPSPACGRGLG